MNKFICAECNKPQDKLIMREGVKGETRDNGGVWVCISDLLRTDRSLSPEMRRHYEGEQS